MTCFSPLSVLQLHCPKPHPANSVHLQKSRSRKIFLTPHSPSPNLLCSGRLGIFWGVLPSPSAERTEKLHRAPLCADSALFPLLSHLQTAAQVSLSHLFWMWHGCNWEFWAGHRGFPAPEKASVTAAPSAPLRVGGSAQNPSCALSQGTPFSSTSLPNFTGNPFLLLFF